MLSLEPATHHGSERYPRALPNRRDRAYGVPIVDGQHPHTPAWGWACTTCRSSRLAQGLRLLLLRPGGRPRAWPVAYPHRASAQEIPDAPPTTTGRIRPIYLDNVATAALGASSKNRQPKSQRLMGPNPGEPLDSTWGPGGNSYSVAFRFSRQELVNASLRRFYRITRPERSTRRCRSFHGLAFYTRLACGAWASSLIWGRNHETLTGRNPQFVPA